MNIVMKNVKQVNNLIYFRIKIQWKGFRVRQHPNRLRGRNCLRITHEMWTIRNVNFESIFSALIYDCIIETTDNDNIETNSISLIQLLILFSVFSRQSLVFNVNQQLYQLHSSNIPHVHRTPVRRAGFRFYSMDSFWRRKINYPMAITYIRFWHKSFT